MKLAVMQPYFFPYLGHFDLIAKVDRWVVFDTAQYIRRGWMNRNRILKPAGGWQYIHVPVRKCPRSTSICDVEIASEPGWKTRVQRQLFHYKGRAPYFWPTMELVDQCIDSGECRLSRLNVHALTIICRALGIQFDPLFLSENDADPGADLNPGVRVLQIAKKFGATTYVNPIGGAHLLDAGVFTRASMKLEFQSFTNPVYETGQYSFEPALSVIDALMWNSTESLRNHLIGSRQREASTES